jgi:cell division protein FtsB
MRLVLAWLVRLALAGGLAYAASLLPFRVFGGGGVERARKLEADLASVREKVVTMRADNERLRRGAVALRDDLGAIERVVRDELGWVKPGEIVLQIE